jgi:hypothetical protein
MKTKKKLIITLLSLFVILAFWNCGGNEIVGTWKYEQGRKWIETTFYADGTLRMDESYSTGIHEGTYEISGSEVTIKTQYFLPTTFKYKVEGDTLILENVEEDFVFEYKRIEESE